MGRAVELVTHKIGRHALNPPLGASGSEPPRQLFSSGRTFHIDYVVEMTDKRNRKVCSRRITMTPEDASGNGGRPLAVEVAIIGAGPIGLMTANLLGLAGIRVLVVERNAGLLGLPRAIAYDAETLRLFSQVGLFDDIAPGLIQDPHVRHLNARNVTLMAADF